MFSAHQNINLTSEEVVSMREQQDATKAETTAEIWPTQASDCVCAALHIYGLYFSTSLSVCIGNILK